VAWIFCSWYMESNSLIGLTAGICTCISMVPQLVKIIREKKAENISYIMLLVLMLGLAIWVWYGINKNDFPVIFTNTFSFIVNMLILVFTIRYKSEKGNNKQN
jgi:MtN3 and saliva related transmembrane protein